ncbi:MAG: bifunctional UDP-sugar hydrolase/5'-nucleotidase [Verrucomicrobiales bacterium]|nr:bifunctional UDP-sugar hydrolase/5'-nucleotidase [Verrucomicrobiales bacterium]
MERRKFLKTSLIAPAGLSIGHSIADDIYEPPADETVRISICHTTDLHGHISPTQTYDGAEDLGGLGRCVTQIRKWRKSNPNHITLDIGDLYQGTHVSLESEGEIMIKLLNAANYDAWVAGNHDFDWGERVFRNAVKQSAMPVLGANLSADGFPAGHSHHDSAGYRNLVPGLIKEVDGIKIGIVGITTPGLPFWLNPGQLGSIAALDPLVETRKAIKSLKERGADCIIAAGHMGLKRWDTDDYANQVNRIISGCPEIDVYIAGHTHRDRESTVIGNTLFTQAGYYGIWAGKVDLTFHKEGARLIRRDADTVLMDQKVVEDPLILQMAGDPLQQSEKALAAPVGTLAIELREGDYDDQGADTQALIASGVIHSLAKRGEKIDGVLHGAFSKEPIPSGPKTLADMWQIVPYENRIVTATLSGDQLIAILEEAFTEGFGKRRLVGFSLSAKWDYKARIRRVSNVKDRDGKPVVPDKRYRIAFNSYDAQSGGRSMLTLREILLKPAATTQYHPIDTREALTDFFLDTETVTRETIMEKAAGKLG